VARLRSALRPGAQVVTEGDAKIVVRRGPLRRCKVTLLQASDGAAVEVRGKVLRENKGIPIEQHHEVLDHEVADPDSADLALGEEGLEGAVGLQGPLERRGERLVEDQEVDLLDAEPSGAFGEAVQGLLVAIVADPDLGLQEDVRPVHLRGADRLADLALTAVGGGGVDVAEAGIECGRDGVPGLVGRRREASGRRRGRGPASRRRRSR